jgi:hypothetical protein
MTEEKPPMAEMREEVKAIFARMKPESLAKMQALYDEYFRPGTDRGSLAPCRTRFYKFSGPSTWERTSATTRRH